MLRLGFKGSNLVSPQIAWTNIQKKRIFFSLDSIQFSINLIVIIHPSINYHPPIIAIIFLILNGGGKKGVPKPFFCVATLLCLSI
jgi:hypothetical protein